MEQARIIIDPNVHFGKPCVKGTRIPVYAVLELLEDGATFDDILRDYYPEITRDDIKACIHYATQLVKNEEVHIAGG